MITYLCVVVFFYQLSTMAFKVSCGMEEFQASNLGRQWADLSKEKPPVKKKVTKPKTKTLKFRTKQLSFSSSALQLKSDQRLNLSPYALCSGKNLRHCNHP